MSFNTMIRPLGRNAGSRAIANACRWGFIAASVSSLPIAPGHAQGVAMEAQLEAIEVSATRSPLPANPPASVASKTSEDLREQLVFNPEDAFSKFPSLTVRKRYFGDRNANVGGRSYGVLEPGRSLVYLDGYLISNFLGRFDAPRWNMVNVEAIERVDAMYGPFSAIYPGNSIGTTLLITERRPKKLEASVSLKYNRHGYDEYGTHERYDSHQFSARLASRTERGLWYAFAVQRQDSRGHPMSFANAVRGVADPKKNFIAPTGAVAVSGIEYDIDPQQRQRAVFGATGIDHSVQDTLNARLGYEISSTQEIEGRLSWWRNDSTVRAETYLRDASGHPIWSGNVSDATYRFALATNAFAPSRRDETHRQVGVTWRTKHPTGWNTSVVATQYRILDDANRQASAAPPQADSGGAGTVTRRDGTGWDTLEFQATYKPIASDLGNGKHSLMLGLHRNHYSLDNEVFQATDWRTTQNELDQRYSGQTTITAAYAQDTWAFAPDWRLTSGLRFEHFVAQDGAQYFAGPPLAQSRYASRSLSAASPKLALHWDATDDLALRASWGQGVRFPNVDELFNGTKTGSSITVSDPNLRPEKSNAVELSVERWFGAHWLRASLFRDDVRDTILRQTDQTVFPSVTRVSNVDRVATTGLELEWRATNVGLKGLDVSGNATWAKAVVKENRANPAQVGKVWLRIPRQRYNVQISYRPSAQWLMSAAWRWSGRQFNTELNVDGNPDTYGGTSYVNQLDLKASWRFARGWEWGLGVNNLTNNKSYQAHPMPQRSIQTELRFALD